MAYFLSKPISLDDEFIRHLVSKESIEALKDTNENSVSHYFHEFQEFRLSLGAIFGYVTEHRMSVGARCEIGVGEPPHRDGRAIRVQQRVVSNLHPINYLSLLLGGP